MGQGGSICGHCPERGHSRLKELLALADPGWKWPAECWRLWRCHRRDRACVQCVSTSKTVDPGHLSRDRPLPRKPRQPPSRSSQYVRPSELTDHCVASSKDRVTSQVGRDLFIEKRVEWAFGKWYPRKTLLQSGDINYETWF